MLARARRRAVQRLVWPRRTRTGAARSRSTPAAEEEDAELDARHASGFLPDRERRRSAGQLAACWPPAGAEPVESTASTTASPSAGFALRPRLPGPAAAWRARRARSTPRSPCPRSGPPRRGRFGIHPALLDAALHGIGARRRRRARGAAPAVRLERGAAGGRGRARLRVRLAPAGARATGSSRSPTAGAPVASIECAGAAAVDPAQLRAPRRPVAAAGDRLEPRPSVGEREAAPDRGRAACAARPRATARRRRSAGAAERRALAARPGLSWLADRIASEPAGRRSPGARSAAAAGEAAPDPGRRGVGPGPLRPVRAPGPLRADRPRRRRRPPRRRCGAALALAPRSRSWRCARAPALAAAGAADRRPLTPSRRRRPWRLDVLQLGHAREPGPGAERAGERRSGRRGADRGPRRRA